MPTTTSGDSFRCPRQAPAFPGSVGDEQALKAAVIRAYRGTLQERYAVSFVREIPQLQDKAGLVSDEMIRAVRGFFLEHLYPTPETREILDAAFDHMKAVMTSPRRMFALLGTAGRSILKLGSLIPSAISAGLHTLEAVQEIRKLEAMMVRAAGKQGLTPQDVEQPEVFRELVRSLPEREIVRFRNEINKLFKHLSNLKLLETTIGILEDSRQKMIERSDLFTEEEVDGITHGLSMMNSGVELYRSLSPEQIEIMHWGVNAIELRWYEEVCGR